jgi:hypothetical protein
VNIFLKKFTLKSVPKFECSNWLFKKKKDFGTDFKVNKFDFRTDFKVNKFEFRTDFKLNKFEL